MSAIAAIIQTDGADAERERIEAMTAAMAYRGPDGIRHQVSGPVALGHCCMHTTAQSLDTSQPLACPDGQIVLIMDGYLTNWEELRSQLQERGVRLRDQSDEELILQAYLEWGQDCPRHIDGEFAFLIWDGRRQEVFCARDHLGLRPLLYHWDGRCLLVASDVAGLLAALPEDPPFNRGYLAEIASDHWFSRDETIYVNIQRLTPAHSFTLDQHGPRLAQYWQLPTEVDFRFERDADYFDHYRELLTDCVRRAARSHLPVGFDVSGGLDSSALFSLAHGLHQDGRLPAPAMHGYSLLAKAGSAADEIDYARDVARHLGTNLTEVPLFRPELEWFERQAHADRDMPIYPNGAMAIGMWKQLASDGCRVSIGGNGGDQWLDGTEQYYAEAIGHGRWDELQDILREDGARLGWSKTALNLLRYGVADLLPAPLQSLKRTLRTALQPGFTDSLYWLTDGMKAELCRRAAEYYATLPAGGLARRKIETITAPYWSLAFDMLSRQQARAGIDGRSPMLSRRFIEFAGSTPNRLKLRDGQSKFIHRQAMYEILPETILNRITKAEFSSNISPNAEKLSKCCLNAFLHSGLGVVDIAGGARLVNHFCDDKFDDRSTWNVWGAYAIAVLALHHARRHGKEVAHD